MKLLDLGCGIRKRNGAIGVDIVQNQVVDVVHDLNRFPWPFDDDSFDDILMDNSLEHFESVVRIMEEVYRISKHGADITIKVPYFRSHYAIDPTHRSFFASHSFAYFDPSHSWNKYYRYSNIKFYVKSVKFDENRRYSKLGMLLFTLPRRIANSRPMFYERYLAPFFPLNEITFYLETLKCGKPDHE